MMCDNSALVRSALYNNDGVQHMNKGCYNNAIASFTLALEILRPVSVSVATASYNQQQQQQQQQQVFYHHHHHHAQTNNTRRTTTTTTMMTQQQEPQQGRNSGSGNSRSNNFQQQQRHHQSSQQRNNVNNGFSSSVSAGSQNSNSCYTPSSSPMSKKQRTTTSHHAVVQRREPTEHTNFIFRDSIDIPVQSILRSEINEKIVTKLSIVVMYNLGLSFHLSALDQSNYCYSNNNIDRLVRAKMLYEYAFEMHMSEVGGCEDVTLLYTLALMNNLGLIYHCLALEEKSQHCFYNMLSTMMFLLEADDARKIKQWDGLLSNVFAYVFLDSKVAAPAA